MSELRLKAQEQETTLKSQTEALEALKKTRNDMHNMIQGDKFQPGLSSSQLKCGPGELVLLMTCCTLIRFDANLMYVAQMY